ncbi:thiolase family protein [Lysinimonas soli]|uniref:propanoyl-CoA C-acyltransferase n=1 Tax=Lysinimonas soli TaxID=1074233 RepID=A0ABW0NRD4_9MICO
MSASVYVTGAVCTPFGKFPERSVTAMVESVVDDVLADADCDPEDIGFVAVGNAIGSLMTGQAMIQGQLALADTPLAGAPVVNVENACASSSSALLLAINAVRSGSCDSALAIGVEKMTSPDRARAFEALAAGIDVTTHAHSGTPRASVFMSIYAQEARDYMAATGATAEAFAHAAAIARLHGSLNPRAQYRTTATPAEILDSRVIDDPLTLLMCSPIGDGAAAVLVSARPHRDAAIAVRAIALRSGRRAEGGELVRRTAAEAFAAAERRPADVDIVEVHDAASSSGLVALEELGVVEHGRAWRRALHDDFRFDGRLPVNTGGGLVSRGHPVGATGAAQIVELVDQLRGRAGGRQVRDARLAVAQNAGGAVTTVPYTSAVCSVTVLERD